MGGSIHLKAVDATLHPLQLVQQWPVERPLLMLHSGQPHPRWGRWTIVAQPQGWLRISHAGVLEVIGQVPSFDTSGDALRDLNTALRAACVADPPRTSLSDVPFLGGWIGGFAYELGALIEPACIGGLTRNNTWPLVELAWCPEVLVYDHGSEQWWQVGPTGRGEAILDRMTASSNLTSTIEPCSIGPLVPTSSDAEHLAAIERTLDYIRAGDVFQANITRRYECQFRGAPRAFLQSAIGAATPRYGAYLELPDERYVVSFSPELFLQVDGRSREVSSRPIKGTRPASVHPRELLDSAKDTAELHMIVDLMRNDLGRVCRFGSVRVDEPRMIESHAAVHHGVGQVSGTLLDGVTMVDLLRATFPAGSITGAPKIRAMQIINELETSSRGWYTGAIGWIGRDGSSALSVAIRTMMLQDGVITYGAGGGIVADSVARDELMECEQKTQVLRATLDRMAHPIPRATSGVAESG